MPESAPKHAELGRRAGRAARWSFALRLADRSIGFARLVVLARLLAPDDFGVFGVASLLLIGLEAFTQTGVTAALVRRPDDARALYPTAWTVQAVRGALLALALWALSPAIAGFFGVPAAQPLVEAMGLVALFRSLTNVAVVELDRALDFRPRFYFMVAGTIVDFGVSVGVALVSPTPGALVAGLVAGSITRLVLSYVVVSIRPRPGWDRAAARELFVFGRWLTIASALIYLVTSIDDMAVAKLLGVGALGLYQMAYLIASLPATQVSNVASEVTLPVYGLLHDDRTRVRRTYLRALEAVLLVVLPMACVLALAAEPLVRVAFGVAWLDMVPALRILALMGALRAFGGCNGSLYAGVGATRYEATTAGVHLVLMALLLYPLTVQAGMVGAALAVTIPMAVSQLYGTARASRLLGLRAGDYARHAGLPALMALAGSLATLAALALTDSDVAALALAAVFGPVLCFMLLRRVAPGRWQELRMIFLPREEAPIAAR